MCPSQGRDPPARRDPAPPSVALYPGTFDPVTLGHIDLIRRASRLFSRLHVGVMDNPSKKPLLSAEERVRLLRAEVEPRGNVEVAFHSGLAVEAAAQLGAAWIVRGLRSEDDAAHAADGLRAAMQVGSDGSGPGAGTPGPVVAARITS